MPTVLRGGSVLDGTGAMPVKQGLVVIEDGRIQAVGREADFGKKDWAGYDVVDVGGATIMPGLINCHEHLEVRHGYGTFQERAAQSTDWGLMRAVRNCLMALQEGCTTVRDVGSKPGVNFTIKRAVKEGLIVGPRVVTCGRPLGMTGGHGWQICLVVDGADNVRQAAREQLREGADLIKCMASGGYVTQGTDAPWSPQYTVEEMRAAFEEAHKAGKKTTVHAHPPAAICAALEAGVDCIEHAGLVDRETAELLAKRGIPVVPTLVETWDMAERGLELGRPKWLVEHSKHNLDKRLGIYKNLVDAKCKLATGTDVLGTVWREMEIMAMGGLTNMQAILAATKNAAEVCDLQAETGTLEKGKWADIVVVDGDPVQDLKAMRQVKMTITQGKIYRPQDLAPATGRAPL
jgi:imidazolonepropionase-like amidohydrolase